MKVRKTPLRMCLGCNEMKEKRDLIRVVKSPEGEITLDKTGKKSGRGAYICNSKECFLKAKNSKRFEKSFKQKIENEVFDLMESEITNE